MIKKRKIYKKSKNIIKEDSLNISIIIHKKNKNHKSMKKTYQIYYQLAVCQLQQLKIQINLQKKYLKI